MIAGIILRSSNDLHILKTCILIMILLTGLLDSRAKLINWGISMLLGLYGGMSSNNFFILCICSMILI